MRLQDIYCYPIKSAAGFAQNEAEVEPAGLRYDRRWMLVDENDRFVSQRSHPKMALLRVALGNELVIHTPGGEVLEIPRAEAEVRAVRVWSDNVLARTYSSDINDWLSEFLGVTVRLVRYDQPRPIDSQYGQADDIVSFADGYPLLVISQASLDDLNSRLTEPVPMVCFRPNLVVSDCSPYAEDNWKRIRVGSVDFDVVKKCKRCVLPTVDPELGERRDSGEPLKTLSGYRRAERGIYFGMNLIPRASGVIRAGQSIELLE